MSLLACPSSQTGQEPVYGPGAGEDLSVTELQMRAEALHVQGRFRMPCPVERIMSDNAMSLMLTLVICECQGMTPGERSIVLANNLAPFEGAPIIDTLVQAGLVVATGETPGRRLVGLTPLGSARMRAYIAGFPDLM